jgi:hypothetical protein
VAAPDVLSLVSSPGFTETACALLSIRT